MDWLSEVNFMDNNDICSLARKPLSRRELAVLQGLSSDCSIKEIAHQLGLSPKTVAHYADRAREKLSVRSNVAAVAAAIKLGMI
jgi:DNA-binding NarL/FixJ family response regulator